jgi:hypothetical protein
MRRKAKRGIAASTERFHGSGLRPHANAPSREGEGGFRAVDGRILNISRWRMPEPDDGPDPNAEGVVAKPGTEARP